MIFKLLDVSIHISWALWNCIYVIDSAQAACVWEGVSFARLFVDSEFCIWDWLFVD